MLLAESGLLEFLQHPTNLVFVVPLVIGVTLFVIQFVGFGLSAAGDHDHDLDHDHDHDVDHDHDLDHEGGFALGDVLRFLNVGRVPFMAVLQSVLLSVGFFGLVATWVLASRLPANVPLLAATIPIGTIAGVLFSKLLTNAIARMIPNVETRENRLAKLLGTEVLVESATVDDKSGRANWKDEGGGLITVYIRTAPGALPISKGAKVRLESFDAKDKVFVCIAADGAGRPQ
ncbi:MAG: hypothetical protein ACAI25_16970 [Planctomycetota bacterium]